MKRVLSVLCLVAVMLSINCVSAFAAENTNAVEIATVSADATMSTRATSPGLWYEEDMGYYGIHNFNVTPEKGANLNVWLKNSHPVWLTVYKTNFLGMYSKVYEERLAAGERDVRVDTNANGKKYLVKIQTDEGSGATMSILVYQN